MPTTSLPRAVGLLKDFVVTEAETIVVGPCRTTHSLQPGTYYAATHRVLLRRREDGIYKVTTRTTT